MIYEAYPPDTRRHALQVDKQLMHLMMVEQVFLSPIRMVNREQQVLL